MYGSQGVKMEKIENEVFSLYIRAHLLFETDTDNTSLEGKNGLCCEVVKLI